MKTGTNNTDPEVLITHLFDASRETVFKAWTDPAQLEKWFAPEGCTICFKKADIHTGGTYHSCVSNPTFGDCWCKGTYIEIQYPEKIIFTMEVTDENENDVSPADAGMPADWPAITTVSVIFKEAGNKTEMQLHQTVSEPLAKATGAYPSWIQMFDRLNNEMKHD